MPPLAITVFTAQGTLSERRGRPGSGYFTIGTAEAARAEAKESLRRKGITYTLKQRGCSDAEIDQAIAKKSTPGQVEFVAIHQGVWVRAAGENPFQFTEADLFRRELARRRLGDRAAR